MCQRKRKPCLSSVHVSLHPLPLIRHLVINIGCCSVAYRGVCLTVIKHCRLSVKHRIVMCRASHRSSQSWTSSSRHPSMTSRRSTVRRGSASSCISPLCSSDWYLAAVIQELMQTDLHRVIRTQQLTDDHCQVRLSILPSLTAPPSH